MLKNSHVLGADTIIDKVAPSDIDKVKFKEELTRNPSDISQESGEENVCIWCSSVEEENIDSMQEVVPKQHIPFFLCGICYTKQDPYNKCSTECFSYACSCCKDCLNSNITSQFDRNSNMKLIKCIC